MPRKVTNSQTQIIPRKIMSESQFVKINCPECKEGEMLERRSRRGKVFFGCSRYPKCKFASWDRVVSEPCPACGSSYLVEKISKREGTRWQCPNKECDYKIAVETAVPKDNGQPSEQHA